MPEPSNKAVFRKLKLRSTKQTEKSVVLTWSKVKGARSYVIYGNKCGKNNKAVKLAVVTGTTKNIVKVNKRKLKKGTYYKFRIAALDGNNKVISKSKYIHVATKGGKPGNYKKVTVNKSVLKKTKKLKKGKSLKLKAKAVLQSRKLKVREHVGLRYESTNTKIATVTKKAPSKPNQKASATYIFMRRMAYIKG